MSWLDAAFQEDPTDLDVREQRAEAYALAGDLDVAIDEFHRLAVTRPPGSERARAQARRDALALEIPRQTAPPMAPNIVLFVLDTVRADHLGTYGYRQAKTPNIDRLASSGVVFEDAMSQAPWTAASISSLMSGLYPSVHGVDSGVRWGTESTTGDLPFLVQKSLSPHHVTLAERLRARGYTTGGFVSNTYVNSVFGLAQGFDHYEDDHSDYTAVTKRRGFETTERVLEWLADVPEPFLLFVHYNDAHWPYDPLPPFDAGTRGYTGTLTPENTHAVVERQGEAIHDLSSEDVDYLVALYDGEIAYADHQVGQVMEALATRTDRPILTVLTSDHGEEFLEHGATSHGYTLYQEQIHVPLIVAGAGLPAQTRIDGVVRTIDVASTILDIAGQDALGQGQSLLPMLDGEPGPDSAFAEATYKTPQRAVRHGDRKRIEGAEGLAQVFDLSADPDEQRALADDPDLAARQDQWAQDNDAARAALGQVGDQVVLDEQTSEALRALGYVE